MLSLLRNTKGEVSTLVIVGLFAVVAAAAFLTTSLNQEQKTTSTRASESCNYDSGVPLQLGQTETDATNAENRVPISLNRYYYDTLGDMSGFRKATDTSILSIPDGSGPTDANVENMMSKMFSYKPKQLTAAYLPPNENDSYVLEVPVDSSTNITMPSLGAYDLGGGYVAMVTFAAEDRVTLHVGRHEYFTGTKTCKNGKTCSGGYWIYVKGICVDKQIVNAYNSVKGAQEAAGADLNPIQLPMIRPGHVIGKPTGTSVFVGVRDNGEFISLYRKYYWGNAPEKDITSGGSNATNPTSPPAQPTTPPSTPTPAQGLTCGYPGDQCCGPSNPDTQIVGRACVVGSTCDVTTKTCKANATPTPTTVRCKSNEYYCKSLSKCVPDDSDELDCPDLGPATATPRPATPIQASANQSQQCPANIVGAMYKYDENGKISFFRVNMTPENGDTFGPKVAHANSDGTKGDPIDGPAFGSKQWQPGRFADITMGVSASRNFYLEVVSSSSPNESCAHMVVTCTRAQNSSPNTEINCTQYQSREALRDGVGFSTTAERTFPAQIGTYNGQPAIIVGG